MSLKEPETSLVTCQRCEIGMLELEGGTDPDDSKDGFTETYACNHCGSKGRYEVDRSGHSIDESFYGACISYE